MKKYPVVYFNSADAKPPLFQRFLLAASMLQRARQAGLPARRLRVEALRLEAIAHFALDQFAASKTLFSELERETEGADRVEAQDWIARIRDAALR